MPHCGHFFSFKMMPVQLAQQQCFLVLSQQHPDPTEVMWQCSQAALSAFD
jgi:hypothetical protein